MNLQFNLETNQLAEYIWQSSRQIRSYLKPDDLYVLNYLLYVKYKGGFEHWNSIHSISESSEIINNWVKLQDHTFKEASNIFTNNLLLLSKGAYYNLLNLFNSIDNHALEHNFLETFELLLTKISSENGKKGGISFQPQELTNLMVSLLNIDQGLVYNPFAGFASLGLNLPIGVNYYGQELDRKTWAIGYLRILAHELPNNTVYKCESSIGGWLYQNSDIKPNYIVGSPPFNIKLQPDQIYFTGTTQRTYEAYFVEKSVESLSINGNAVISVTRAFLSTKGPEEDLRKKLVDNDFIEYIISFPGGIFQNTGIPFSLIKINKNKAQKGYITFIEGENYILKLKSKIKVIQVQDILNSLSPNIPNSNNLIINASDIQNQNYNLEIKRYSNFDLDLDEDSSLVLLSELGSIISRDNRNSGRDGRFIRIRDLQDDSLYSETSFTDIRIEQLPKFCTEISENVILVATRWNKLKPTLFRYNAEPIFISNDIIAIKINENIINSMYLIHELSSEYVLKQTIKYQTGNTVPAISKSDLLKIMIQVPHFGSQKSLELQKAKVQGIKEAYFNQRSRELFLEKEILGIKENSFRDIASILHSVRQYLNALKSNVGGTVKFLKNNASNNITLESIYSYNLNSTLGDQFTSLQNTIDDMVSLLKDLEFDQRDIFLETNNLKVLVEEAKKMFEDQDIFQFEELYFEAESFQDGYEELLPLVKISKLNFNKIFSNIIDNAVKHGFKNRDKVFIIRTSISYDSEQEKCLLQISNNGIPINKDFSLERFITRGEKTSDSTGSGIGGNDINEILKKHGGSLNWISDEISEFPVIIEIKLPLLKDVLDEN